MTEEVSVVPPEEANLPKETVWRLRRALNDLRCAAAAFQAYLESLLEDDGVQVGHGGSVHLQQRGRRCEHVSTRR